MAALAKDISELLTIGESIAFYWYTLQNCPVFLVWIERIGSLDDPSSSLVYSLLTSCPAISDSDKLKFTQARPMYDIKTPVLHYY